MAATTAAAAGINITRVTSGPATRSRGTATATAVSPGSTLRAAAAKFNLKQFTRSNGYGSFGISTAAAISSAP